jgi:hypothetical protein
VPYKDNVAPHEDVILSLSKDIALLFDFIPVKSKDIQQPKVVILNLPKGISIDLRLFQLNNNNLPENQSHSPIDLNKIELNNKLLL